MKKTEQIIHPLISLTILNVNKEGESTYNWSSAEYESERKQHERLLMSFRDNLTLRVGVYHKGDIEYRVISDLDGDSKTLSLSLVLAYYETDFELNELIYESENFVSMMLNSIEEISTANVSNLNSLDIQEHDGRTTTIEDGTVYVPRSLKHSICGLLRSSNGSKEATYSINDKKVHISLPKTSSEIIESEENEEFTGRIYGVDEKDKTVRIVATDKMKSEKHPYQSGLEGALLTAQINKDLVKLRVLKNYSISIGAKIERPGTIIGVESPDQHSFKFSV